MGDFQLVQNLAKDLRDGELSRGFVQGKRREVVKNVIFDESPYIIDKEDFDEIVKSKAFTKGEIEDFRKIVGNDLIFLRPHMRWREEKLIEKKCGYGSPKRECLIKMIDKYGIRPENYGSRRGSKTDERLDIAEAAVRALGKIGSEKAVINLTHILRNDKYYLTLRNQAILAIGVIARREGPSRQYIGESIPHLINLYLYPKRIIFIDAISETFAKIGKPVVPYLIPLLNNKHPRIRLRAGEMLKKLGHNIKGRKYELVKMVQDKKTVEKRERMEAIKELGRSGLDENAVTLITLSKVVLDESEDKDVRYRAGFELAKIVGALDASKIGDKAARDVARALGKLLPEMGMVSRQKNAVILVGKMGYKESIPPLVKVIRKTKSQSVIRESIRALFAIGSNKKNADVIPQITTEIINILEKKINRPVEGATRIIAANTLGKICSPDAVAALTRALSDPHKHLPHLAMKALKKCQER